MSEFTWKPATPPPLSAERGSPELSLPDPIDPAASLAPAAESGGQWAMSASDRLLPDAEEQRKSLGRGTKTAVAAAVAVIAGVLMVEMVRRSPEVPPVTAARMPPQASTVAAIETVKPAPPAPPSAATPVPRHAPAVVPEPAPITAEEKAVPPTEPKAAEPSEPKSEAKTEVASRPSAEEPPPPATAELPAAKHAPATPVAKSAAAKEPVKTPLQTGSLAPAASKGGPAAPRVLNAQQAAGAGAPASAPSTKSGSGMATTGHVKPAPAQRPAPANDAYSPHQTEPPPMRTAAAPRVPANDAYSPRSAERMDREELPPVRPAPTGGPVVGMPVPSMPRSHPGDAREDEEFADAPDRRPPPPDGRDYWRSTPPPERPRFQTSTRPLAPPSVDSRDPNQVRAMAVGLHPQTPPDWLRRLSSADYRNANIAIQTALAETPDGRSFVWPREQWAEQATYLVRVGRGREPGCRRYVVKIEKDGRTVTTPEMETCSAR